MQLLAIIGTFQIFSRVYELVQLRFLLFQFSKNVLQTQNIQN